jgi:hypothetical protein
LNKSEEVSFGGSFLSFLSSVKRSGGSRIIILALVGVFIISLGFITGSGEQDSESDEGRLSALCEAIDGVGRCRVYVSYSPSGYSSGQGRVEGVAIVCDGADRAAVRSEIIELVSALYGIGSNRISVSKMK